MKILIIFLSPQATIPDPDDKKPEDWDKPETIPDPEATRPDDWDDEMVSIRVEFILN